MTTALEDRLYEVPRAVEACTCVRYIEEGNRRGWIASDVRLLNPMFARSQSSVAVDTAGLLRAIRQAVPARLDGMEVLSLVPERTSCLRYTEGEYFGVHEDAPFVAGDGRAVTKLSLLLYLNDDYRGGETVFPDLNVEVRPETGKVLLFAPQLRHLSRPILRGEKYIIRSEVLYRFPPGPILESGDEA